MSLNELIEMLREILQMPFSYLLSPAKRVFIPYLISSFILALFVYFRTKQRDSFMNYFFSKKRWLGSSAIVDYGFMFINSLIKVIFVAPILFLILYIAEGINDFLFEQFGESNFNWSVGVIAIVYTIVIVVVNDFFSFLIHYLMHKVPFLWRFHKIHHSATELNPFTQYRLHPVEIIINNLRGIMVKAVITGLFLYLANGIPNIITIIYEINILNFLFLFFGANLRHSHVKLTYWNRLETILISPFQHQIHHSNAARHYNKNLGSKLAIWDWMFGTLIKSKDVSNVTYGLGNEDKDYNSFLKNLINPFLVKKSK